MPATTRRLLELAVLALGLLHGLGLEFMRMSNASNRRTRVSALT
jgi:hypothetical protein